MDRVIAEEGQTKPKKRFRGGGSCSGSRNFGELPHFRNLPSAISMANLMV